VIDLDDELELPSPRGRHPKDLRQPLAPTSEPNTRSDSWWMTCPDRAGFTARCEQQRERMASSREWKQISSNQVIGWPAV
jgi:hypothetical protein